MDIKSWILLVGTLLIVAVICHGFWTAYRVRKNDVRMDIETDLPDDDLDDMVLLSGELPNGGARVTPTVGYDALRVQKRKPFDSGAGKADASSVVDPLEEALSALDDAVASAEDGLAPELETFDEGDFDAGYKPEQATLDLEMEALEERFAARAASASAAPLLTDAQGEATVPTSQLPPKKQITPERAREVPRKQFEPPFPEELEAQRIAEREQDQKQQAARERAEREREELAALAKQQEERERQKQAQHEAKVEAQRIRRLEQEQREAQARIDAQKRLQAKEAKALAKAKAQAQTRQPEQLSLAAEPLVEFPETTDARAATQGSATGSQLPAEELVVLNVVAKTRAFHGGDVLELFLRNGIKFGDMNIFHRMDPVSKASQYSIASVTEPGYFDLHAMPGEEFRGLCLFMQLPCSSQATKVFTDMLTVADKLARQLDGEVCDEQFNRLTRQSTEHYRQRVAEFTRRNMSRRA